METSQNQINKLTLFVYSLSTPLFVYRAYSFHKKLRLLHPSIHPSFCRNLSLLPVLCKPPTTPHSTIMAANGTQAFAPVLAALQTMQSNVDRSQKGQAHEFLEQFQKSVCEKSHGTWHMAHGILQTPTDHSRTKHGTQPS
jgi:hypothetical protein